MKDKKAKLKWVALIAGMLALIIVPFICFGARMDAWTQRFLNSAADRPGLTASILSGLLASDIVLPIPSSIVSTACGYFLGFWGGALASWLGMSVSGVLGYALAVGLGRAPLRRWLGDCELEKLEALYRRYGDWVIVLARPVPVLAEASVLFAGLGRMRFWRFLVLSLLSNAGISVAYAAIGTFSADLNSFLAAMSGAILLPWVFMVISKRYPSR